MTSQTHIDMLPQLPEGFAWEVVENGFEFNGSRFDTFPARVKIVHWLEPGPWKTPDQVSASIYDNSKVFPPANDDEFYDYARLLQGRKEQIMDPCDRFHATHYRSNGKTIAKQADLSDRWTPEELISVAHDTYELWQIRLAQRGLYGTYPSKETA